MREYTVNAFTHELMFYMEQLVRRGPRILHEHCVWAFFA
jgi:hypothetical protein